MFCDPNLQPAAALQPRCIRPYDHDSVPGTFCAHAHDNNVWLTYRYPACFIQQSSCVDSLLRYSSPRSQGDPRPLDTPPRWHWQRSRRLHIPETPKLAFTNSRLTLSVEPRAGRPSLRALDCRFSRMRCFLETALSLTAPTKCHAYSFHIPRMQLRRAFRVHNQHLSRPLPVSTTLKELLDLLHSWCGQDNLIR